jgi:hypothetical protein
VDIENIAKDLFHSIVYVELPKENWIITDDPSKLGAGGAKFEIDLGAKRLLAIAIEIKTFAGESLITDYHAALRQFLNCRLALKLNGIDRALYLAVPALVYEAFFQKEFLQISVKRYQIQLIIYEPINEVIEQRIN